jgi:hypothetical protein
VYEAAELVWVRVLVQVAAVAVALLELVQVVQWVA